MQNLGEVSSFVVSCLWQHADMCLGFAGGSMALEESSDEEPLIEMAGKSRGNRLAGKEDRAGARTPQRNQRSTSREDDGK